ncbi:MAG: phage late control D family protein [Acetobacteraceae bacterium]|nr:phage late control D family protein [Acetobacteraceae bacterium]
MPRDAPLTINARPTINIGGQALPLLSANIFRFVMREQQGGLSSLELSLVDVLGFGDGSAGYGATAGSPVQLGAEIAVYAGDSSAPPAEFPRQAVFKGTITAIEAEAGPNTSPLFTVLAEDRLWKARRTRKSHVFEQASPADIARRIAGDHGLRPEIRDGLDQPVSDWVQMNESDLAFLRRILLAFDADLLLVEDRMQVGKVADEPRSSLRLVLGAGLLRARITADLADQASEVRVGGFDPATGEKVAGRASAGTLGPGQGQDGPSLLRPLLDPAREHVGHHGALTEGEARQLAEALYARRARGFVRADATAEGNPDLRVGSQVEIAGVNPFFENTYTVTEATHRFDLDRGYLTDFRAECAYLGRGP